MERSVLAKWWSHVVVESCLLRGGWKFVGSKRSKALPVLCTMLIYFVPWNQLFSTRWNFYNSSTVIFYNSYLFVNFKAYIRWLTLVWWQSLQKQVVTLAWEISSILQAKDFLWPYESIIFLKNRGSISMLKRLHVPQKPWCHMIMERANIMIISLELCTEGV